MKTIIKNIRLALAAAALLPLLMTSCEEGGWDTTPTDDLFRPVFQSDPEVTSSSIAYSWSGINGAVDYTIQLTKDDFTTIFAEQTLEGTKYTFTGLSSNTKYKARVRSNAPVAENTSQWFVSKEATTSPRVVPTVLLAPEAADITDFSVTLHWNTATYINKISVASVGLTPAFEQDYPLNDTDRANGYLLISSLTPGTTYTATAYDTTIANPDENYYNTITFATTSSVPVGAIELSGTDNFTTALETALADPTVTSMVFYFKDGYAAALTDATIINKPITIMSDGGPVRPSLTMPTGNGFKPATGCTSMSFTGIDFKGVAGATYVTNSASDSPFTMTSVAFDNCTFTGFANSIMRTQAADATQSVTSVTMTNCIVASCSTGSSYSVIHIGGTGVASISISNSTFYNLGRGIVDAQKLTASSVSLRSCTIYDLGNASNYVLRCDGLTGSMVIENTIFSMMKSGATQYTARRGTASFSASGNITTSDYVQNTGSSSAYVVTATAYPGSSTDLFTAPYTVGSAPAPAAANFAIKDSAIRSQRIGDPRWLPAE